MLEVITVPSAIRTRPDELLLLHALAPNPLRSQ